MVRMRAIAREKGKRKGIEIEIVVVVTKQGRIG